MSLDEIKRQLKKRLYKIDEREDFSLCVIANARNPENWQRIINFIDNNPSEADYETVLAYSVLIDDMSEQPYERKNNG